MLITELVPLDKVRMKLVFDHADPFWLYKSDIRELQIEEGMELTPDLYERIRQAKVLLYAKKKTLELLERMDRTEQELKTKLSQRDFPSDIVDAAIAYARSFHYVDDFRYTLNFISMRSQSKSKKQICFSLYQKGVSKETVTRAYETFIETREELEQEDHVNPEVEAIRKIVRRKGRPIEEYSKEELLKLTASLYRKGFSRDCIRQVLSVDSDWD